MTQTKLNSYGNLFSLHDRINRFFIDELRGLSHGTDDLGSWYPAVDIYETKNDYVFKLEVPGISKYDVSVEFDNHILYIKGEKKDEKELKKEDYHRIECYKGKFSRSFSLPKNVDSSKINASLKNGILELKIQKAEEQKAKSIAIKDQNVNN